MKNTRHDLLNRLTAPRDGIAFRYWDSQNRAYLLLTYDELYQRASMLAEDLRKAGMSHQPVMITFPQGLEFVQVVLACMLAEVVFIPLHQIRTKSDVSLLESMARSTLTPWVLSPHSLGGIAQSSQSVGSFYLEELRGYGAGGQNTHDACFLQYSSGTTHKPKGVMISCDNLIACLEKMIETMEITPDDHGCIWLPAYQDLGLIGGVFLPLYHGFPLTLMSPRTFILNPLKWIEVMTEQQVTITAAPNFAYDLCVDRMKADPYEFDLKHLRIALNGAELIKPRTVERFTQAFKPYNFNPKAFYPAYGLTEATLMVSASHPLEEMRRVRVPTLAPCEIISSGKPMRGVTVKIIKDQQEVGPLEMGEIWISGPTVAQRYWNDVHASEAKFNQSLPHSIFDMNAYVKSGDIGFVDHEGYLYVLGRLDDQVTYQGKFYLSEYLEDVALEKFHQDAIYKTVAFATPEDGLIILCEISNHSQKLYPLMEQAAQAVNETFGLEEVTIALVKRGAIPVTTNGKIKRHAAQVLYQYGVIEVLAEKTYTFPIEQTSAKILLMRR